MSSPVRHVIWGSELSPFALKVRASFQHAGVPHRFLPAEGGRFENARVGALMELAKGRHRVIRYPEGSPLDEYPLVPFVVEDGRRVFYDSSAIGHWLDETSGGAAPPLFPESPALGFVARLIDEAFDEFGLYLLHHNRWVVSATDNDAGLRVAREFSWLIPPGLTGAVAGRFSRRQIRRLPYLFSVAPVGFSAPGLPPERTPPSRAGFPPTHALIEEAWQAYVDATERVLSSRPFLLGERFTIADASAFGQLGGNFIDPSARRRLEARAPHAFARLEAIWRGAHAGSAGRVGLDHALGPLLEIIGRTFVPLMQLNEAAFIRHSRAGETVFNERAFNRGRALFEGEMLGHPFRAVVKTFQVQVWRDLRAAWEALPPADRTGIELLARCDLGFHPEY